MPTVLLITERERVRWLFAELEQASAFRLRLAPTLGQAEEEIAARPPQFVFFDNHLTGLAAATVAQYLKGLLPEETPIILLASHSAEAVEFMQGGETFALDLSLDDEVLRQRLAEIMQPPEAPPAPPAPAPAPAEASAALQVGAREYLMRAPERPDAAQGRGPLWLIPLTLAVLALCVVGYRGLQQPAARPAQQSVKPQPAAPVPGATASSIPHREAKAGSPSIAPPADASKQSGKPRSYLVRPGDFLLLVLERDFGFTRTEANRAIPELKRLNHLSDLNLVLPGQTVLIPERPTR